MQKWWALDVQIYHQVFYSLYSIKGIRKNGLCENNIGIFFCLQSLLTSLANISKAITNVDGYAEYLSVDKTLIPNILDRTARNTNEHFEERYMKALLNNEYIYDMAIGSHDSSSKNIVRYFNTATDTLQFLNSSSQICTLKLSDIEKELKYIQSLDPISYIFERYDGFDKIL